MATLSPLIDVKIGASLYIDEMCSICKDETEDVEHVFKNCPEAIEIWKHVLPHREWSMQHRLGLKEWLSHKSQPSLADHNHHAVWNTLFLVIIWSIWRWRNN